jgi:hypothetical protein
MAGDYRLRVVADLRGDMVESNESNNMMLVELPILAAVPRLPRLGLEELILEGVLEQDQKLNIFVVINNTGEADAMNVVVNFTVDGKALGSASPISVIGRQTNRTASWPWVPAAGRHIIDVTVSADGIGEQSISRSVTVPRAPSVASPYMLAAGMVILAVMLGAVTGRAISSTRRPAPRLRLIEEEEAGNDMDGDDGEATAGEREA